MNLPVSLEPTGAKTRYATTAKNIRQDKTPKAHIVLNIAHLFAGEIVYDGVDRTAWLRALEEGKKKKEKQKVTSSNQE